MSAYQNPCESVYRLPFSLPRQALLWAVAVGVPGALLPALPPTVALLPPALWLAWLLPGALLVRLLLPRPRTQVQAVEGALLSVAAGASFAVLVMLLVSYAPGGVERRALIALFLLLDTLLLAAALRWGEAPAAVTLLPAGRGFGAALVGVVALGGVLRLTHLGYSEFQGDEARVMLRAGDILQGYANTLWIHHKAPGELLTSATFYGLLGTSSEWAARLPFALAGISGLALLFVLGYRLFGLAGGLSAGLLAAVDGYMVAFGRIVQYQSVIFLTSMAVLLLLWGGREEGRRLHGRFALAGMIAAGGLLFHYELLGIGLPALLILVYLRHEGVPLRRLVSALLPGAILALVMAAAFFVPYLRYPGISTAYQYVVNERLGLSFPYNNVADFAQRTLLYSSSYYVLFLVAVVLVCAAVLVRRQWGTMAGLVAAVLLGMAGWGAVAAPAWLQTGGRDLSGLPVSLLLTGVALLPALTRAERLIWSWFISLLIFALFLVARPDSHVYVFFLPLALAVGSGVQLLWQGAATHPAARFGLAGAGALPLALFALWPWLLFADAPVERLRRWETERPAAYWYPFDEPPGRAILGFPLRNGWAQVGAAYAEGVLAGSFESNARPEVADWYTRGAGACPAPQRYFFLTTTVEPTDDAQLDAVRAEVEQQYRLAGSVADATGARLRVYARAPTVEETPFVWQTDDPGAGWQDLLAQPMLSRRGRVLAAQPQNANAARFGEAIRLLGFDLSRALVAAGENVELTLWWESLRPTPTSYTVFLHVVDPSTNTKVGQMDALPICGQNLTNLWNPGDRLRDPQSVQIAAETPPGVYQIYMGLYDVLTGARLPVFDAAGAPLGDYINLTTITVE